MMQQQDKNIYLGKKYEENLAFLQQELGEGESFDLIIREFEVLGKKAALICFDGFAKDDIMVEVMKSLFGLKPVGFLKNDVKEILTRGIPYLEVDTENKVDDLLYSVLSGSILLIIDGSDQAFIIDARTYPARQPEEPDVERVVRGSRDGFTETIVFNTALLRRRVRDPKLRLELMKIGKRSKSDVCVAYIKDVANPDLVEDIKGRLSAITIDGLPMAEKTVEELITPPSRWNPFPTVRYTERPDVAAVHLLEGHVLIIVDTSPSVIIAPSTYFHHIQHAEEYRQEPVVGVYIRWIRMLAILGSILVTPVWMLLALHPELLPESLKFIGPQKVGYVPLFLQFILAEIAIDLVRMAAIHTPSPMATALGVVAALLIGDLAARIGLLTPEVILYTAVVAVGMYSTPSYELSMANRLVRLLLLVMVGFFGLPGLVVGLIAVSVLLVFTRSFGVPYLWPLVPFNWSALKGILIREPVAIQNWRPQALKPLDSRRQPGPAYKKRKQDND